MHRDGNISVLQGDVGDEADWLHCPRRHPRMQQKRRRRLAGDMSRIFGIQLEFFIGQP